MVRFTCRQSDKTNRVIEAGFVLWSIESIAQNAVSQRKIQQIADGTSTFSKTN